MAWDSSDTGALAGIGVSAATGNFIGAAIGAVGLGLSIFGGASQASAAKQAAQIQGNITGLEGQVNDQRQNAMQLDARRKSLEQFRLMQRTQAAATAAATTQGAQFGSGLQGGLGQIAGQGLFNIAGINQNEEIGTNIFGLNRQVSAEKMMLSGVQTKMATAQGLSSLGGSVMQAASPISRLSQGVGFGGSSGTSNYNSGNPVY